MIQNLMMSWNICKISATIEYGNGILINLNIGKLMHNKKECKSS